MPQPNQTPPPGLLIRPLLPRDPKDFEAAFAAIGWHKPASQYQRYLQEQSRDERLVFVATGSDGAFRGYTTLMWVSDYEPFKERRIPEIKDLNVLPHFRQRGVGTALIQAAERAAHQRHHTIGIGVGLTSDYGAAQRLYVRLNYIPDGRGIAYQGKPLTHGDQTTVDDDLVLYFTKKLGGASQ